MSSLYTLIPRPIGSFAGLDMASRYAFGLIFDRWQLSAKDSSGKYKDKFGPYCVFSRDALAAEMGITLPTLRKAMHQLIDREIIHARCPVSGCAWRYYVPRNIIDELKADRKPQQETTDRSGYNPRTGDYMQRKSKDEIAACVAACVVDLDADEP